MAINTTIYSNHNLEIPTNSNEIIELLKYIWKEKIDFFENIEIDEQNQTLDSRYYKIYVNPRLIEFEVKKFNQDEGSLPLSKVE